MLEVSQVTAATREAVWSVLADGFRYAAWVVGAARVRAADEGWPAPGTKIHHSTGCWPVLVHDVTEVVACTPTHMLALQARGWPAGEARVEVELVPEDDGMGCRVVLREDATHGPGRRVPYPLRQRLIVPRNRESLRRLIYLAERPRP